MSNKQVVPHLQDRLGNDLTNALLAGGQGAGSHGRDGNGLDAQLVLSATASDASLYHTAQRTGNAQRDTLRGSLSTFPTSGVGEMEAKYALGARLEDFSHAARVTRTKSLSERLTRAYTDTRTTRSASVHPANSQSQEDGTAHHTISRSA